MNPVITAEQAKQVTGGRTPLVPVEYEAALKALRACAKLDEAKYWDNQADALAAWARIYRNDEAGIEARRLKLHAYRRMGVLASQVCPKKIPAKDGTRRYATTGAPAILRSHGFSRNVAKTIAATARIPENEFETLVNAKSPPSPTWANVLTGENSDWRRCAQGLQSAMACCRKYDPASLARSLPPESAERAKKLVVDIAEWLDAFEQALPKVKK